MTSSPPHTFFTSLPRKTAAGGVFDRMVESILSGDLEPGSTVPPERKLSEQFGLSRLLVRQAIHRLADLGLVRVRQGGSTTVMDPAECDHPQIGELALRYSPDRDALLGALRERQIAGSLALLALASRRATPEDIEELTNLLDWHEETPEETEKLGERFWKRIAEAAGNPFFRRETHYWFRIAREHPRIESRPTTPHADKLRAYRKVIGALATGTDAVAAYHPVIHTLLDLNDRQAGDASSA